MLVKSLNMQKSALVFILGIFFINAVHAQMEEKVANNVKSLLEAERSFARLANDSNIRCAFLYYLDDSAIIFRNGEIVNGKEVYKTNNNNKALLTWEPVLADVSASGDFGYDTGPSEYRNLRSYEKPVYFGDFISVWTRQTDGNWKVILDLGIGHHEPQNKEKLTASAILLRNDRRDYKIDFKKELTSREKSFIKSFDEEGIDAYMPLISDEARFYRAGSMPLIKPDSIKEMLNLQKSNKKIIYQLVDGNTAQSGDLGYMYGTATIEFLDTKKVEKTNYLRIWKKEDGSNWKIVIDALLK
jgi:ketosteroid isomerase-like protein